MSRLLNFYGEYDVDEPQHIGGEVVTVDYDIVVIGGGGSGLSASARASELGAKVLLIDKMQQLGGNSRLSGGLLCTNSQILQDEGVPDTTEAHIDLYRRTHLYQLDPGIYEKFIRNTGRYYDWLASHGLDTENKKIIMDNVVMVRDRTEWEPLRNPAYGPGIMGSAVTDLLIRMVTESPNTDVLLETKAKHLITDDEGGITGVKATGAGHTWEIYADHVILCSGGFGCNNALLQKYFPQYFTSRNYFTHYCLKHCTGDGLLMAQEIGAKTGEFMSIGLESMNHMPGAHTLQRICVQPEGIVVSASGRRFVSEDDMENGEYAMDAQPDGLGWYLFSEPMKDTMYQLALDHARYGDFMPSFDVYYQDLEDEIKTGLVRYGSTTQELADQIGAPSDVLSQTLETYHEYCAEGCDHAFAKDAQYLLDHGTQGPWYAIRLVRKFDVTMGGVSINSDYMAVRPDGEPISGLYVCGDIASGWMGNEYGPLFSSFAWALNSGFLAAEDALRT